MSIFRQAQYDNHIEHFCININMKKLTLLLSMAFAFSASAQNNSWKIKLNNKSLLSTSKEDETKNIRKISAATWKKNGFLEISFKEAEPGKWYRSFLLYDKEDNELFRKDSTTKLKIAFADLKKLLNGKKELIIYTTIAPTDPTIAIRVRRVHLCTLQFP